MLEKVLISLVILGFLTGIFVLGFLVGTGRAENDVLFSCAKKGEASMEKGSITCVLTSKD